MALKVTAACVQYAGALLLPHSQCIHGWSGHVGWGISWYINGLLIPEVTVVRGKKYTFVVEGGSDPAVPARYHPFYITNDPVGGYHHKSDAEKKVTPHFYHLLVP